jgi:molybdate transport system substrate-binding protein
VALCLLVACNSEQSSTPPAVDPKPAGEATPAAETGPITVFAASSLKELMTGIAGEVKTKTGREVRLQFEASSTLARQIKEGAPADVFVTAAPEWLDELKVLDRFDWLSNRLVVVARKDVEGDFDLARAESLAMANEQVPAGTYARAALEHLRIKPPERVIFGSSVRDVLSKVSQGGAQAGIVYATDAAIDPAVRIAYTFPEESHPKILYSVGVITENGRAFASALREPAAIQAATTAGFVELK